MTVSTVFNEFCSSIKLLEDAHWNGRIKEITKKLTGNTMKMSTMIKIIDY